jgi:hypothetical protein
MMILFASTVASELQSSGKRSEDGERILEKVEDVDFHRDAPLRSPS